MRISRWLVGTYIAVILAGLVVALPSLLPPAAVSHLPPWLQAKQISLGLDLKGGSHLVLEVDEANLDQERAGTLREDVSRALKAGNITTQSVVLKGSTVTITLPDGADSQAAVARLAPLNHRATTGAHTGQPELTIDTKGDVITVVASEAGRAGNLERAVAQSLEVIRLRIDQVGVAEPTVQKIGSNRILVQLPGAQGPGRLRELLGSTAKLTFHLLAADAQPRPGVTLMQDDQGITYPVMERIEVAGEQLADARADFNPQTNEPVVSFRFDQAGATRFGQITQQNVGRPFAIVLDGKVLSAPRINEPIMGGAGQISGSFTTESASTLAAMLRAGALPAKLNIIEERSVGADLGSDAIAKGVTAGLVGFALVAAFIFVLYGRWGWLTNTALLLHTLLTFSALALIGATLTLPGIAGIVLGIGLAVDANVLINERIREERRKGKSLYACIDVGFNRAYSTITDGNVTALIAAAILYTLGSGPVRGFAITTALGLVISMFTSVAIVRAAMFIIARKAKLREINIRSMLPFADRLATNHIPFMKARYVGVALSAALSLASLGLFFAPGLNYGVDFKGGIQLTVRSERPIDIAAFRSELNALELGEITPQSLGEANNLLIRAPRQPGGEAVQGEAVAKLKAEISRLDPTAKVISTDVIGPKVSGELAQAGILALLLASVAMLFYIWWRFEWPFAVGAIITLVLDITKLIGFFALTQIDFNLTAIAAVLTMVGYSVNDKVVVYDRMRENMRLYKSMPFQELIDKSINETLARSIYTNVTAFLAILPLAVIGGKAVESFAVPMAFGIVVAGASSIFIAAPILLFLGDWRRKRGATTTAQ